MRLRILFALFLLATLIGLCQGQNLASPYSNSVFPAQIFTATGQTGKVLQLNGLTLPSSTVGSSFASGTITVAGTSLTTVTFALQGSSDNGITYFPLPLNPIATPGTLSTSITATANGMYQVSLAGLTHVRFVTSGTFTATTVSITLTASPNGIASVRGSGTGGGATLPPTPSIVKSVTALTSTSAIDGTDYLSPVSGMPKTGGTFTGAVTLGGSLLSTADPVQAAPALINFHAALHSASTATAPVYVLCIGDSICRGTGPKLAANTPINQLITQMQQYGVGGTGFIPVGFGPNGGNGTANSGWQAVGSAPFPTLECSFGPQQTGANASCSIWKAQPGEALRLVGGTGNFLEVAGVTDSTTSAITVNVDGVVVGTTIGGTTTVPTPFFVRLPLPAALSSSRQATFTPTNPTGFYKLYGAGFENASGIQSINMAVPGMRACGFGDAATINQKLAFLNILNPTPSVAIIELGTNDTNNTGGPFSQAQYQTCMSNIANYVRGINPQISLVFWDGENVVNAGIGGNMTPAQMQQAERALAVQFSGQYVSIKDNWGSEANANVMGLMAADATHPSDTGGQSQGAILWQALGDNVSASASQSTSNMLTIPQNWHGNGTASGHTVTLTLTANIQSFDTSATIEVESCADAAYNTTGTNPTSISKNIITYTVTGTPGASTTGCFLNTNHYILDASLLTGSNLYFINNIDNLAQTGTLINVKPGQTVNFTMICADSVTNVCLPSSWPSQFIYAPPTPLTNGGKVGMSVIFDSNLTPNIISPTPPRALSGALSTNPIPAGTCVTLLATLPTTLTANGGYFLNPTRVVIASPQTPPGTGLTWFAYLPSSTNPVIQQSQVNIDVCNPPGALAPVTPVATKFNVVAF